MYSREISDYCIVAPWTMRVLFGIAFCMFAIISTTLADSNEVATEKDDLRNKKGTTYIYI